MRQEMSVGIHPVQDSSRQVPRNLMEFVEYLFKLTQGITFMEAQSGSESPPIRITVLNGTHKGKTGLLVSRSDHYTKIRLEDDTVIRCKNAFAKEAIEHGPDHNNHMNEDDALLQEMILASLIQEENEQKKKEKELIEMLNIITITVGIDFCIDALHKVEIFLMILLEAMILQMKWRKYLKDKAQRSLNS